MDEFQEQVNESLTCACAVQSTWMASREVSEASVYACTGNPRPCDIERIADWLFNSPFVETFANIQEMQVLRGLALLDIVQELHP